METQLTGIFFNAIILLMYEAKDRLDEKTQIIKILKSKNDTRNIDTDWVF